MSMSDHSPRMPLFICPTCGHKSNGLCQFPCNVTEQLLGDRRNRQPNPESEPELERSPIDARVIAINETEHYNFPPEHAPYIRAIRGVYLYDANQRTYCCELTPSHWLIFLYNSLLLTKAGEALDDEKWEALYNEYEINNGDDCYMHCSTVERLAKATGDYLKYGATEVSYEDSNYDDQIEELMEYFSGNPPF